MKLSPEYIEFEDFPAFASFLYENELIGIAQMANPIQDKNGKVLIQENAKLKGGMISKLETMHGQYEPIFHIKITFELVERLKSRFIESIYTRLDKDSVEDMISMLFNSETERTISYKGVIEHSLRDSFIVISSYRLWREKKKYFSYSIESALLSMGIAYSVEMPIKYLHRYAFLAGLFMDLALSENEYWKIPLQRDAQMMQLADFSSSLGRKIGLPSFVQEAIRRHWIPGMYWGGGGPEELELDMERISDHPFKLFQDKEIKEPEVEPELVEYLIEILKIVRFLKETMKKVPDNENTSKTILTMFAYNLEKKIFKEEIAEPFIKKFKTYEAIIDRMRAIAKIEKQCQYPPAAWAYPKPQATQVLCKNNVESCPFYERGWDLKIVSQQEAYGYVGTPLKPGNYPKCRLEKRLKELK
ncbi:MAG: hypothetical protein H7A25_17485 [Leptospiraceae bacterium]|nr:hypothetical protein [Leptospiraceae bacterium]